jgi:type IV pilus biogenesis/stability protein PilW
VKLEQDGLVRRKSGSSWAAAGVCLGLLAAAGCVSEERMKKADGYYQEGVAVLNSGDQQSAYVSFQKALKENSRHRDAHYYVAFIYASQEKFDQAEAEVREAIRTDPDYPDAYNFLGQVLIKQNRRQEAIAAFRKAVSYPLYSTPDVAYDQLGLALEMEGDMQNARQAFEDALKVAPPNVPQAMVYLELGRVHYKLGEDGKAREALARAVSLDKDKSGAVSAEARALMERLKL